MLKYFVAFSYLTPNGQLNMGNTTIDVSAKIRTDADIIILEQQVSKKCSNIPDIVTESIVVTNFLLLD